MNSLTHRALSIEKTVDGFIIIQPVGEAPGDCVTLEISSDQAKQIGNFLLQGLAAQTAIGSAKNSASLDVGFADFWESYPRKINKAETHKIWRSRALAGKAAVIAAHLGFISKTQGWTDEGGRFVPHPSTYLRRQQYLDEQTEQDVWA